MPQYIGQTDSDYVNGEHYAIMKLPMVGRIFKPGKDSKGNWLDTVGERDTRIMVWKNLFGPEAKQGYRVYESEEAILKDFDMTY